MHRKPFKPVGEIRSTKKLQLVHSDVCGPMHTESIGGKKYFVTFIDDYSRCCDVYFLRHKSEALEKFKQFEAEITNVSGEKIKALCTDNGGEYLSKDFKAYLKSQGTYVHHELTVSYSPEQNGVAERMNRTLMESARAMITHAGLPNRYWAEAVATAAYIRNRAPTAAIKSGATPYERWYGRKPKVSHLKVFGCTAYAHVLDAERRKLDKKAVKLYFVGYRQNSKGYRLFDEDGKKIVVKRDVTFYETDLAIKEIETELITQKETMVVDPNLKEGDGVQDESPQQPQREKRERLPPVRYGRDEYADTATIECRANHGTKELKRSTNNRLCEGVEDGRGFVI